MSWRARPSGVTPSILRSGSARSASADSSGLITSRRVAWPIGGQPVAAMPPDPGRDLLAARRAEIPVEKIQGAVLLLSGKDDGIWQSARMADAIVDRLKHNHFAFSFQHLSYDHAGHSIARPYTSTMSLNALRHPLTGNIVHLGGTPAGT